MGPTLGYLEPQRFCIPLMLLRATWASGLGGLDASLFLPEVLRRRQEDLGHQRHRRGLTETWVCLAEGLW